MSGPIIMPGGAQVNATDGGIVAELWYSRDNPDQFVEVALIDVRASDSIRVSFDFDRSG